MGEEESSAKREMNWAAAFDSVIHRFITSGFGLHVIGVLFCLGFLWILTSNLESADLKSLIESIFGSKLFSLSGWILFAVAVFVGVGLIRFQKRTYEGQMKHLRESLDEALQIKSNVKRNAK